MSAAGNSGRSLRRRTAVDYTGRAFDAQFSEAGVAADDPAVDPSADPAVDPAADSSEDDSSEDDSSEDDSSEDDSSEDDSEYDEDDDGGHRIARTRVAKTDAERAAEVQVAEGLHLPYPKGFLAARKGLAYAYRAACRGSRAVGVRYAMQRLILDDRLQPDDLDAVITMCQALADTITTPRQALANTFEPLSRFRGGYFTKMGMHSNMPLFCAIALGVEMCDKIAEYRANGSAQAQGFAQLLGNAGLGGDVVSVLTEQHATETPQESARVAGEKLAEQLNALDGEALVQVLFYNLATFPQRAARFQPHGHKLSRDYDYSRFDHTKPNGALEIARNKGVVCVSLSLLHSPLDSDTHARKLVDAYGADAAAARAGYRECRAFPDSAFVPSRAQLEAADTTVRMQLFEKPPPELKRAKEAVDAAEALARGTEDCAAPEHHRAFERARAQYDKLYEKLRVKGNERVVAEYRREYEERKESLLAGCYVETHRAQADYFAAVGIDERAPPPTPKQRAMGIARTFKTMLVSTAEGDKELGVKLKSYLDGAVLPLYRRKTDAGLDVKASNAWGVGNHAYVALKINDCPFKLGRQRERNRSIHDKGQGHLASGVLVPQKQQHLQRWLKLDRDLDLKSFAQIMCPPWKMEGTGLFEFFVLLSDTPPEDVINVRRPRELAWEDGAKVAERRAEQSREVADAVAALKEKFYADMHRGENPERIQKKRLKPEEKEQVQDVIDDAVDAARLAYARANPRWPSFDMNYSQADLDANRETPQKRARDREAAIATKRARANHRDVVAANPDFGGDDIANTTGFGGDAERGGGDDDAA